MAKVDNEKLYEEILLHKKKMEIAKLENKEEPRYSNYIGQAILDIAYGISKLPKFSSYSFKEEMIGDGYQNTLLYLHNFDETKYKNPFSYIYTIIYYAFLRRIEDEKKRLYVKYKIMANRGMYSEVISELDENNDLQTVETYDNITEFIDTFEKKLKEKSEKIKKKKPSKGLEEFIIDENIIKEIIGNDS